MDLHTAPTAVMELISYACKGTCSSGVTVSRATVSAVFQPCRTCYMLFVLYARCVLYVFLANK